MKKYIFLSVFFICTANAQVIENFSFEQTSSNDSCTLSLSTKNGEVRGASIDLKNLADKTLTDEEIALGANKIWINELSWTGMQDAKNSIWIEEKSGPRQTKRVTQETFQVEDKLKVFVTTNSGNSRAILDLMVKVVPSKDDPKKLDFYFVASKNNKKTLSELFKEKFADDVEKIKSDKSYCFKMNYSSNSNNELNAELWGVKTLSIQE